MGVTTVVEGGGVGTGSRRTVEDCGMVYAVIPATILPRVVCSVLVAPSRMFTTWYCGISSGGKMAAPVGISTARSSWRMGPLISRG